MMDGGHNKDDQFQGSLSADDGNEQEQQNDAQNLDLGAILGGLMGGGQQGGMPDMQGSAGGLDLGSLLGGLLGGGMMGGGMGGAQAGGMGGTPFDGIISSIAGDLSAKTGLPKEIISMGALFLISKLMLGGASGNQQAGGEQQAGGLDLGGLLGSILGGAMPGMDQGAPQEGDEVMGKIGKQINEGLNSPHLTAGGLQQSGLASEFAEMSGMDEHEAAQSLSKIADALKQSGLGQ